MILNELKDEAKKRGYYLVKIPERVRLLPCPVCGTKRTEVWTCNHGNFRVCGKCSFRGDYAKTERESVKKWNEAVMRVTNDH